MNDDISEEKIDTANNAILSYFDGEITKHDAEQRIDEVRLDLID